MKHNHMSEPQTASTGFTSASLRFLTDRVEPVSLTEALAIPSSDGTFVWIHLDVNLVGPVQTLLTETFGFHPLEVEDALQPYERPSINLTDDHIFCVIPCVVVADPEDESFVELACFVRSNLIVTVADQPTENVAFWQREFLARPPYHRTPAHVFHALLDHAVDQYFPALDRISDEIERYEDAVFINDSRAKNLDAITHKRRLLQLRRNILPLRDILTMLIHTEHHTFFESRSLYFRDVLDHVLRLIESIDIERDLLTGLLDVSLAMGANRLNVVMKKMTVISTILMTASLIAGIYGMNFHYIPELRMPQGYFYALAGMVVAALAELAVFRRLGWL